MKLLSYNRSRMKYINCFLLTLISVSVFGQDAENCSDHPLLKRIPNTIITQCSSGNEEIGIATSDTSNALVSGLRYFAEMRYIGKTPAPKFSQIEANYENQLTAIGGKKIYGNDSAGVATYFSPLKGKELWVTISDKSDDSPGSYEIIAIESDPATKKVTVMSMYDDLETKGSTVLYFKFENNKSIISSESLGLIDKIADMLTTDTDLNLSIEGHTDNNGFAAENERVSESRAKSVYNALIEKGIDASRLRYKGWGRTKPVADNTTEEGRAKNNRIELVKK